MQFVTWRLNQPKFTVALVSYLYTMCSTTQNYDTLKIMSELILTCKHQKIQEAQQQHRPAIAYVTNESCYLSDS